MKTHYKQEDIETLTEAFDFDQDYEALALHRRELAAIRDFIAHDNQAALKWLKDQGHKHLVAFCLAVLKDKKAFMYLWKNKYYVWGATSRVVHKDSKARKFLKQHRLDYYIDLAEKIQNIRYPRVSYGGAYYGGSIGGGSASGGGFGGFGGGSFGGGGAGGSW